VKFSHDWIATYVPLRDAPEEFGRRMTAAGIPLDGIERPDGAAAGVVYDFDIFANRPDCMSHFGLAREAAALYGLPLQRDAAPVHAGGPATASLVSVTIEDAGLCARYSARCVVGVKVGPSPAWLRARLEQIGHRPINNIVDATNFVLWELGHPLHAFDLDRVGEKRIVVRRARPGETLVTLDGIERRLTPEMLVIADARRPSALAGVMGGATSEIGPATTRILIESAWFDPVSVRRTSKVLGLHTDASHRFERGADPEATLVALDRAATLIVELGGGVASDPPIDEHPRRQPARTVTLRPRRAQSLLGVDQDRVAMRTILGRLGFQVDEADAEAWRVLVPSFRRDVEREVDLIEEVARHRGYDAIPSAMPILPGAGEGRGALEALVHRVGAALRGTGLSEAINFAMADAEECRLFEPDLTPVPIENPLQSQSAALRTTLLPGLLRNLAHNLNHGLPGCQLFEIGTVFRPGDGRPGEEVRAAGVLAGRGQPVHWSLPRRAVDHHDARGAVETVAERLGMPPLRFSSDRIPASAAVTGVRVGIGSADVGMVGEVAPRILRRFGIDGPVFAFDLDLGRIALAPAAGAVFRGLPRFPAVRRDLAVIVRETVTLQAIEEVLRAACTLPIAEVQVFDRYRGKGVPEGCASVGLQVVFQHPERTLQAEEVQAAHEAMVAALSARLGAELRGMAK
jgi:phenylalanyl-tRNA synthetase beta chain